MSQLNSVSISKEQDNKNILHQKNIFSIGQHVVYPSHGVGILVNEEIQIIANITISLYVISFLKDKMLLRLPKIKAIKTGMRNLSSISQLKDALWILEQKPKRIKKQIWPKRAQEYNLKINSGDIISLAMAVRDLHRNEDESNNCSYSEKNLYEVALERLTHEYSIVMGLKEEEGLAKILNILSYRI